MICHLTQPVFILNRKRNVRGRSVTDTLENGVDEIDSLLLKTEILQKCRLRKLHVQIYRLA